MVGQSGQVWKYPGWYVVPNDARAVMSLVGSIGSYSAGQQFAWRGMSSADHNLNSSLQRKLGYHAKESHVRAAEQSILTEARSWGLGIGDTDFQDDLQLLADLQHFGVPTRLIDFTSNPMTALWFACLDSKTPGVTRSGLLLALNVTKWKTYQSIGEAYPDDDADTPASGRTLAHALSTQQPFIVQSSHPNARLRAQEGFFVSSVVPPTSTLVRALSTPFWALTVPKFAAGPRELLATQLNGDRGQGAPSTLPFVAVIVKAGLKPKLRRFLEGTYNRTAKVLFPDLSGYAERGKYGDLFGRVIARDE